jgi:hypothetical protein
MCALDIDGRRGQALPPVRQAIAAIPHKTVSAAAAEALAAPFANPGMAVA